MQLNAQIKEKKQRPIKVLQFGEGNFLRSFVDYMIDVANDKGIFNGNIAIIKPIPFGSLESFQKQDCLYTALIRGIENGKEVDQHKVITSIEEVINPFEDFEKYMNLACSEDLEFVVSNTTEAGIVFDDSDQFDLQPANTFPGKVTQFLHKRFNHFKGATTSGLTFLPCELIEKNGDNLKKCILDYVSLWNLGEDFALWVESANIFCNTLVDKIVPGFPKDEAAELEKTLGYTDELMTASEPFAFWAIETDQPVRESFPMDQLGLNVIFTPDMTPYRERKVGILNGAHTAMVCAAHLAGKVTVRESVTDEVIKSFVSKCVFDEIIPTLSLPEEELKAFANAVLERFANPFIRHELLSITLNTSSKWKVRVLPSLKKSLMANGSLPEALTFSFAAYLAFYRATSSDTATNRTKGDLCYDLKDDQYALDLFMSLKDASNADLAKAVLKDTTLWGEDLSLLPSFVDKVTSYLDAIDSQGMYTTLKDVTEA